MIQNSWNNIVIHSYLKIIIFHGSYLKKYLLDINIFNLDKKY